jgi:hypothetical protein
MKKNGTFVLPAGLYQRRARVYAGFSRPGMQLRASVKKNKILNTCLDAGNNASGRVKTGALLFCD